MALDAVTDGLEATGIEGLWLHLHPSAGRRLFARSGWRLAWGRGESRDELGLVHGPTLQRLTRTPDRADAPV